MDKKNGKEHTAAYTVIGLAFVTLGITLFDDEEVMRISFIGAGMLFLIYSAFVGFRSSKSDSGIEKDK